MAVVIRILDACLTHDTQLLSSMNPYVTMQYGNEKRMSSACQFSGKTPFWGQTFTFTRVPSPNLKVEIWDRQTWLPDDLIGQGILNMMPILMSPPGIHTIQTVHLFYQGRSSGVLNLSIVVQGPLANTGPVGYSYQQWTYEKQLDALQKQRRGIQSGWGTGW